MEDEPEIVKLLREEERLETSRGKSQSNYEELQISKGSSDYISGKTIYSVKNDGERKKIKDGSSFSKSFEELRASEERFRSLLETINDLVWEVNKNGVYTYVNPGVKNLLGYEPEEIIGKTPFDFMALDEIDRVAKIFQDIIKKQESFTALEKINLNKDGQQVVIETSGTPFFDVNGNLIGYRGIDRDITERKKAEETLRANRDRYLSTIELTGLLGWTTNADGEVLEDIPTWRKFTGQSEEEVKGVGWSRALHPDDVEHSVEVWKKAVATKSKYEVEYRVRRYDGVYRHFLTRGAPVLNKDGNIIEWVGACIDITERKKTKDKLQHNETKYRTLVENLPQKIFLKDQNSVYISCNKNYAKDLKIKPEEIDGTTDYDFFPKDLAEKYKLDDKRLMELGKTEDIEEKYTQDGQDFWVHTIKTPVRDKEGDIVGILGIFRDITEQKILQDTIKQSNERYRIMFESANDTIIILSKEGKIEEINAKASEMLGYHKEDFLGRNLKEIMHLFPLKSKMIIMKNFALRILGKEIKPYEVEMIRSDGEILSIEINAVPLKKDGKIVGDFAILHDVTNRKKAEDELKRKINELERFENVTVDRELMMVELKTEINELCKKYGEKPRYDIHKGDVKE